MQNLPARQTRPRAAPARRLFKRLPARRTQPPARKRSSLALRRTSLCLGLNPDVTSFLVSSTGAPRVSQVPAVLKRVTSRTTPTALVGHGPIIRMLLFQDCLALA